MTMLKNEIKPQNTARAIRGVNLKLKVFDGYFTHHYFSMVLPFTDWLRAQLGWPIYACHLKKPGWKTGHPFYVLKCWRHGYYLDYPAGLEGYNQGFSCPFCLNEIFGKVNVGCTVEG